MTSKKKERLCIFIMIISFLLFFTVFIPYYYLPYKNFLSETRYFNNLAFGFGANTSVYCFFYFICKKTKWFDKIFPKYKLLISSVTFILIMGLEALYQYSWCYNNDSSLQYAFSILGSLFYFSYLSWLWKED